MSYRMGTAPLPGPHPRRTETVPARAVITEDGVELHPTRPITLEPGDSTTFGADGAGHPICIIERAGFWRRRLTILAAWMRGQRGPDLRVVEVRRTP
jgi:hypothetical protein